MANKVSVIIDVAVDQANRGLKSFRDSIADADGAAGKFKAGVGSAFDSLKANAGNLAVAGGAALVAFGVKAVGAFQDTALEAGRLSESLGLTTEEASRFMEVAGDLGIDMGTLEKSIGKMNIEVEKSPAYFDEIGAAIAKNADGTTNVQQTFLNVVDAINKMPDASARAAASQKLLRGGWKEMAELVGQGSDKLKASLDAVSDAKVIDAAEVEKARNYRAAMDQLSDAAEDVALVVGEAVVPALTDLVDTIQTIRSAIDSLPSIPDALGGPLGKTFDLFTNPLKFAKDSVNELGDAIDGTAAQVEDLTTIMAANATTAVEAAGAATALAASTEDLTGSTKAHTNAVKADMLAQQAANAAEIEAINSSLGYRNQVARTTEAVAAATAVQQSATATDTERAQAARDAEGAVLAQAEAAVKLATDTAEARGQTLTANAQTQVYVAELQKLAGQLTGPTALAIQGYINQLNQIPRNITTTVTVNKVGDFIGGSFDGRRAEGGPVNAGGTYLVGEDGPEILQLGSKSGNVIPNDKIQSTPTSLGGMDPAAWGRMAADAFARRMQQNGRVA